MSDLSHDVRLADRDVTRDVHWVSRGACVGEDPELFFPIGTSGPALWQIEDAKRVCRRCDVAASCLEWALTTGVSDGVWGGLSEMERRALIRRRTSRPMAQR